MLFIIMAYLQLGAAPASVAQIVSKRAASDITLPSGARIRLLSTGRLARAKKGSFYFLKVKLVSGKNTKKNVTFVADQIFVLSGPRLEKKGERKIAITILTDKKKLPSPNSYTRLSAEKLSTFYYTRKEPGIWIPEGRVIPKWMKPTRQTVVLLSDGKQVLEERATLVPGFRGKPVPKVSLLIKNFKVTKHLIPVLRKYTREKLSKVVKRFSNFQFEVYTEPYRYGIHFRQRARIFVMRKSNNDFWLASSIGKYWFTKSKSYALKIVYHPEKALKSFKGTSAFQKQARAIFQRYGSILAKRLKVDTVIIQAKWGADKIGQPGVLFGTVFQKSGSGGWRMIPNKLP